jgi:hypothetical protein
MDWILISLSWRTNEYNKFYYYEKGYSPSLLTGPSTANGLLIAIAKFNLYYIILSFWVGMAWVRVWACVIVPAWR